MDKSKLLDVAVVFAIVLTTCLALRAEESAQAQPGLATVMFESTNFTRPTGLAVMEQVNVDTGWKVNDYTRIWVGRIKAPASGQIEVFAEADDGLRLNIGDKKIIDGWGKDQPRSGSFTAAEKDQLLPLRLEYYQDGGEGFIRLYWSWPGHAKELIPASAFFHTAADRAEAEKVMNAGGPIVPAPVPPAGPETPDKSFIYVPGKKYPATAPLEVTPANPGPHLLIDDALIASAQNVTRVVMRPKRDSAIPNPLVKGTQDQCFQPYMTISRSPETGRFRIWYGIWTPNQSTSASNLAYMESDDGINWVRPHRVTESGTFQFGSEVLDRGPYWPDQSQRYVYSHWYAGLRLAVSPDGLHFVPLVDRAVVAHNHDINSIAFDPLRQRYVATMSTFTTHPRFKGARRTTMQSFTNGQNLLDWTPPSFVLVADDSVDEGQTQFYAMEGFVNRGPLRIAMVKILRDDLFSDTDEVLKARGGDFGIGYTTLAWTRDGEHWIRDREVFFDRGPEGLWDRSHAWIDEQVIVGDEVYLYYGGYRSGHKANRFADRQIGMVKMAVDRYVARQAGEQTGSLVTTPLKLDQHCKRLFLNADPSGGQIRVQLKSAQGAVIDGFGFDDCKPITSDGLRTQVLWGDEARTRRKLAELALAEGNTVQLEFELKNSSLFGFEFADSLEQTQTASSAARD